MNSKPMISLAVLLVILVPGLVRAQDEAEEEVFTGTDGEAEVGIWDTTVDGSPDLVLEYEPDGTGPDLKLDVLSLGEKGSVDYDGRIRQSNDMVNTLDFDIDRVFRSYNVLNTLLHRLGKVEVDRFETATNHGRVVYHTDLNPDSEYEIDYQLLENWNQIQAKGLPNLVFGFGYRDQRREGLRQLTTVSHCDACHINSLDRPTDERTTDVGADLTWGFRHGFVRAGYNARSYSDDPTSIPFTWDRALQPELRTPVFDNRMAYDSLNSPQAIDVRNDTSKNTLSLDGLWASPKGLNVAAEGVWSETKNDGTDVKSEFSGYAASVNKRFGNDRKWNFRWRGRAYNIENTDFFVDTPERVTIAGPHAGRTYREIYDFNPDFTRLSARNRDVLRSKADVSYRFNRQIGTLRFIWDYDSIDREFYEVAPGVTKTTSNELGVTWSARPAKGWKTYALLAFGDASNPFNAVNSQFSTLVSPPSGGSPFSPLAAQYYEMHAARIAEGAAVPDSWTRIELRGGYTGTRASVTANYRYWDGENTSGDLTDWSRLNQAASVTLWSSPAPRWQWHLGYTWNDSGTDLTGNIPLFDG